MSWGHIAKIDHWGFGNCDPADKTATKDQQVIVHDAEIYFGNSGGGLFDEDGNLIGINIRAVVLSYPPAQCGLPIEPQIRVTMWGMAVGLQSLLEFING